ncbi:MAG: hypothetical protein ACLRT4_04585 [Thomasclavelia sp.]
MYINTTSKKNIEASLCKILNINKEKLYEIIDECYHQFQENHQVLVLDKQYDFFDEFVKNNQVEMIDQVMFVHLSRRLKDDQDNNGYNFVDTLTKETSLSNFMKKYGISFKYDDYIKMFVNNKEIDLDNEDDSFSYYYLKNRFGYRYKDFNFKGYMFGDNLENSEIYQIHEEGPEFFGYLFLFTDDKMIDDFYNESKYYRYEYLVPLDMIYFEDYDDLGNEDKQRHIIVSCLQRLYNYKYDPLMNDTENKVIGILDQQSLSFKYLIRKIEI